MRKLGVSRFVHLVAILAAVGMATACNDNKTVVEVGGFGPTAPTPTGTVVTAVVVSSPTSSVTLNACPQTLGFTATVLGTNVTQSISWDNMTVPVVSFATSGVTATLVIDRAGTYVVTARTTQGGGKSGSHTVTATGNCSSGPGPGPAPPPTPGPAETRTISIEPNGGSGEVGTTQQVTATCRVNGTIVSCTPEWSSSITDRVRVVSGNPGQTVTIRYISPHSAEVCAVWEGVRACGVFTGTEASPAPTPPSPPSPPPPSPPTNQCAGASASLPSIAAKGQTVGFAINVSAGCQWALRSNNPHVVSTNPAQGTGPSAGTVTALNSGTATIQFVVNPGGAGETVVSSRVYIIP